MIVLPPVCKFAQAEEEAMESERFKNPSAVFGGEHQNKHLVNN